MFFRQLSLLNPCRISCLTKIFLYTGPPQGPSLSVFMNHVQDKVVKN